MMGRGRYVLDDSGNVIRCDDLMAWAAWFEKADRRLACNQVNDDVRVSTIFLGLDYNLGTGQPILWETMIFGGPHDGYESRYDSREAALAGHAEALALARECAAGDSTA